ncbi:hypothetical protein [Pseudomonas turukhanskensis]|uniref:Lipoprotein n=1 Tax=Pseudomonas turukhanskensis TaxID=1806536 RepID=A0A9W6K2F8_9PSED|nr:hypothetical protein [Pseudomonas turukhanskensis]GLK88305.1 hypothetical protein GCM10017655_13670 [Pseudomonas turukhanskensis]
MKRLSFLLFSALTVALTGCSTPPPKPIAGVVLERLGDNESGVCMVKINFYNKSAVAWDGLSYQVLARDQNGSVVGQWRGVPLRFTDPGTGFFFAPTQPAEAACAQITRTVVQYLGVLPTGRGQVRLNDALISSDLK